MHNQISPSGVREAKIAIISDYPEDDDISRGVPFASNTLYGRALDDLLRQVGINRSELYFTYIFKHKPLSGVSGYIKYNKKSNKFTFTQTYYDCRDALYEELKSVKANVFIPLGDASLYALAGQWGIHARRGSIYQGVEGIDERKVIGTIHPKDAVKEYTLNYSILADLSRIKVQAEFPEVILPKINLIIKPSFEESIKYLKLCMTKPRVGFDIETVNQEVSCISFAYKDTEGISIPFLWQGFSHYTDSEEAEIWNQIGLLLENPDIYKITQNGMFDTTFLFSKYGIRCVSLGDTMIQHGVLYPELRKSLGFITSIQTEEQYYKDEGKFIQGVSRATDTDMAAYNIKDSTVLMTAYPKLEVNLQKQGNMETYDYQRRLVPILSYMNTLGMRMDHAGMKEAKRNALYKRDEAKVKIHELSDGIIDNPNSHIQLKRYFYGVLGIKPIRAKGGVVVDQPAMKKISLMGHKIADDILDFRHHKTYGSQFYGMILGDDNRFRNSTNPVGTKNLRLSSTSNFEGEGTNAQNMPNLLKRFVLADRGFILYDLDLGQAENRIVAYVAPEPAMVTAFEQEVDVHAKTASLIFNVPIDQIIADDKAGIVCSFGDGKHTMRFWGKQSNHSFNYDLGPITFARKYGIHVVDSKKLIGLYHSSYPGVRQYHAWVRSELQRNKQTLTNPYGHSRRFMGRLGDQMNKQAYNYIPQSTVAAKINREGLVHIFEDQDSYRPMQLLNQVHDSIVLQIPLSIPFTEHAEMIAKIRDNLEQEIEWMGRKFVIPLDAKMGFNLGKNNSETNPKGMIDVDISHKISASSITQNLNTVFESLQHGS